MDVTNDILLARLVFWTGPGQNDEPITSRIVHLEGPPSPPLAINGFRQRGEAHPACHGRRTRPEVRAVLLLLYIASHHRMKKLQHLHWVCY